MPNGANRNFVRYISCISGFRATFNHWPTKVRLDLGFMKELREVMAPEDYRKMSQTITLIPDGSNPWDGSYIAEDDEGNTYDLIRRGHGPSHIDVLGWLGIKYPDYGSHQTEAAT